MVMKIFVQTIEIPIVLITTGNSRNCRDTHSIYIYWVTESGYILFGCFEMRIHTKYMHITSVDI